MSSVGRGGFSLHAATGAAVMDERGRGCCWCDRARARSPRRAVRAGGIARNMSLSRDCFTRLEGARKHVESGGGRREPALPGRWSDRPRSEESPSSRCADEPQEMAQTSILLEVDPFEVDMVHVDAAEPIGLAAPLDHAAPMGQRYGPATIPRGKLASEHAPSEQLSRGHGRSRFCSKRCSPVCLLMRSSASRARASSSSAAYACASITSRSGVLLVLMRSSARSGRSVAVSTSPRR